jgi:hypothetical protein
MLATLGAQRSLQTVPWLEEGMERWARSWARRWFIVEAPSAAAARTQVRRYLDACVACATRGPVASEYGIVESGKNPAGGPDAFPSRDRVAHRPAPAKRAQRRARGPTSGGDHPL